MIQKSTKKSSSFLTASPSKKNHSMHLSLFSMFDLLHLQGEQTEKFLQSQLTNDVTARLPNCLQWQAYCSRQGLVQSFFGLWSVDQNFYLLLPKTLTAHTCALLQKYGVFSKVQISLCPLEEIYLTLEESTEKNRTWEIESFSEKSLHLRWRSCFEPLTLSPSIECLKAAMILHTLPWLYQETIDCFYSHDLNFPEDGVVSFKKGCFPGQEIIARTQYRGKPKKHYVALVLDKLVTAHPGEEFSDPNNDHSQIVDITNVEGKSYLGLVQRNKFVL